MLAPVAAGYLWWSTSLRSRNGGEERAGWISRHLGRIALVGSAAPLMLLVVWVAHVAGPSAGLLPFVGLSVHIAGSAAGWAIARFGDASGRTRGAYLLGGGCSNVLTFGSITVLLLLRTPDDPHAETAIACMAIYRLLEAPYYFLLAWPTAAAISASDSAGAGEPLRWGTLARRALFGPNAAPAIGIIAGGALNLLDVPRPGVLDGVSDVLVRVNVVLLGLSVGLSLRSAAPLRHLGACMHISAVKFLVMPAVGFGLAWCAGFDPATLRVVAICSAMPVAFMAVVGATLYELDEELVGSFWLFTTVAMIAVIPILALALPLVE